MRAGKLRTKLTIQTKIASTGDGMGGGGIAYWEDGSDVWGNVMQLTGTEKTIAFQKRSEENCKIILRYSTEITSKNRLRLGDTTTIFDIVSFENVDLRNRQLVLYCRQET